MLKYRYETHSHSSEVSRCSRMTGAELVRFYKGLDYTGIFVTDHFLNGNTAVPKELPWEERVELFMKGYENALEEGKRVGLDVFFAWEYTYKGSDHLTYGLDKEWLLAHPDVCDWTPIEYFDRVHADGAFVVHAHPMRRAKYIKMITLFPEQSDAVEVDNSSMLDIVNEHGLWYAESFGLLKTVGSDTHYTENRTRFAGVDIPYKINGALDYAAAVKSGEAEMFSLNI